MKQRRKLLGKYPQKKEAVQQLYKDIMKAVRADTRQFSNTLVNKFKQRPKYKNQNMKAGKQ